MVARILLCLLAIAIAWVFRGDESVLAQQPFYQGKNLRLIVGTSAGGGFDTYSRAIARHMGRHIPGNPAIIVENMPGAAHLISANHLFKVAKPDGLTFGNFTGALLFSQVLGRPGIEFDARKFHYLGAPIRDISICALSKRSGVTSLQQWRGAANPVKMGSIGPGDFTYEVPKVVSHALNLPAQVVAGYKGTAEIRLAVENGEVDGLCMDWNSIRSTWRKALDAGDVVVVIRVTPSPDSEIAKIPLAADLAKTAEAKNLIRVAVQDRGSIFRPYLTPPGVPKDRLEVLRRAFHGTLKDPEFLADAKKSNLNIDPVSGEELDKIVSSMFGLDAAFVSRLNEILK
jgi:tripartite-type tricarboxylate transporter receptor subunit TctC